MMNRKKPADQRELSWYEATHLGQIHVSSDVKLYSIKDIIEMTGWSESTVQKLFNDPQFPAIDYGKSKLVGNHALMQYLSVRREKANSPYWRNGIAGTRRKKNG